MYAKSGFIAFALLLSAATAHADNIVVDWNVQAGSSIGAGGRRGPSGILDFALVQAAVHDAVQAYEGRFERYCNGSVTPQGSPIAAAAAAAHGVLIALFPGQATTLHNKLTETLTAYDKLGDPGVATGQQAAACVLQRLAADNAKRAQPDTFVGGSGIGQWRPTSLTSGGQPVPIVAEFIATFTPFTLRDPAQFRAANAPPKLQSGAYAKAYEEARLLGRKTESNRSQEQTNIGLFFADAPPGYWNRAMQQLATHPDRPLNLGDSARMFALVNMAMADSVITSWDSKIAWNFWRPVTAIREGHLDGNPNTIPDPLWEPLVGTPNYPDYTSGANNLAGAAATMLANLFGTDEVEFTLRSLTIPAPDNVRSYSRFSDAGRDVVDARIYMGIHFRFADTVAYRQGAHVANWAFGKFLRPVAGN
jgi:hypothetical protein